MYKYTAERPNPGSEAQLLTSDHEQTKFRRSAAATDFSLEIGTKNSKTDEGILLVNIL